MWEARFIKLSKEIATWSKDPEEGVGALLVSTDRRSFSPGYNGFPKDVADENWRLSDKEIKRSLTVHAELNAILNAKRDLTGWSLYITKAPCLDCALDIIQAGITSVYFPCLDDKSSWFESCQNAISVLSEARVMIKQY